MASFSNTFMFGKLPSIVWISEEHVAFKGAITRCVAYLNKKKIKVRKYYNKTSFTTKLSYKLLILLLMIPVFARNRLWSVYVLIVSVT